MNFQIIELQENDTVMTTMYIGNLEPEKIDNYCENALTKLKEIFGTQVAVFPDRDNGWDFTIVRRPKTDKKVTTIDVGTLPPEKAANKLAKVKKSKRS